MSTTYEFPGKEDVHITVGDEKQQEFSPRMKIKRWDNEVNFSVGIISTFRGSYDKVGDKVEWNDGHGIGARFYEKPDDQFEFEIILDEKPDSGFVLLSIEHKGLRFLYQPELTQQEIDDGAERPDNVVGSYAVYHKTMAGNYVGGKNYRAGKFCHIYRPYVTDANGKREWCDMDIIGAVMKITIPDGLVYPVVVDPTFGCDPESPGNTFRAHSSDTMIGVLYTSPADIDTAQSISVYIKRGSPSGNSLKGCIVLHSSLNIISNGVGGATTITGTAAPSWITSVFGTDPTLTPSTEYLLMHIDNPPMFYYTYTYYDTGDANQGHVDASNNYTTPANLGSAAHSTDRYSIYCTYTAGGAPSGGSPAGKALNGSLWGPFSGPIV